MCKSFHSYENNNKNKIIYISNCVANVKHTSVYIYVYARADIYCVDRGGNSGFLACILKHRYYYLREFQAI